MKILFFTPFAARNGAEMMLLYLIKNLDQAKFKIALFSFLKGDLLLDVPKHVTIYLPKKITRKRRLKHLWKRINGEEPISFIEEDIAGINDLFKPDIWYINTILCSEVVVYAKKYSVPFIIHFHELLFLYEHVSYEKLKMMVQDAKLLIGCSKKVCENIQIMGGSNVVLQYEFVDFLNIKINSNNVSSLKKQLNPKGSFIWVMSGSLEYRKGADLVSQIANHFGSKIIILWLGLGSSGYSFFIEQEINYYGLNNILFLGGKISDYYDYLSIADGLMLTSREDPFPLVMIEAGYLGKPIVAFDSGGSKEFVIKNTGLVVESNNLNDYIEAMELVMNNGINFNKNTAINRALEFDARNQVKKLEKTLLNLQP